MAATASSSLFMSRANAWRLLSLRSDVDDILLELLGRFSLDKIYAEGDKETYQHLVVSLLIHLNAIFTIQRLSLPSESLQIGWYLGFLVSWECTLRTVEFCIQVVVEGRDSLWERTSLRDKYLAEFLFSALRVLTLHPKAPANQRAKDRRERFARIHRSLERLYDSYPGPKSFLLLVCKDITDALRTEPNALALPTKLRYELPNLASELYPLPECLSSQYISTIVSPDGFSGVWLSQFLALRDVSQFVVGASVQYTVNRETRDVRLQSSSARTRNAVLHALDNLRIPSHLSKVDLISTFSETFRVILPDTPSLVRRDSTGSQGDETEMDAIDSLCAKLHERQIIHRMSDREMMHNISEITRNIALLDDPSGQSRTGKPRLYVINCQKCHFAGESQLRNIENLQLPLDPDKASEISLPPQSKCIHCGEDVTIVREISLARHTWDLLKPLEPAIDTINVERHLPTQFQLAPPKESGMPFHSGYGNILSGGGQRSHDIEPSSPHHQPAFLESPSAERSRSISQAFPSPNSPSFRHTLDTPQTEFSRSEHIASIEGATFDSQSKFDARRASNPSTEPPFSPDSITSRALSQPRIDPLISTVSFDPPTPLVRTRTVPLVAPPEKGKSSWRSKFGSRKDSNKASGDTSSLSSTTLEAQRLDEISLKSLASGTKVSIRGKSAKNINVYLSQNSTYGLFWTQSLIHIWDVGTSPPTMVRSIATESTCLLAAVTKVHLAYIIGTRDQKLTLRIVNLVQQAAPVVEYRMPSSLWCRSISVCPKENYVVVGFENSIVRFFKTASSETPREDRLHGRYHKECKECPPVETLSFSNDGLVLLGSTRDPRNGTIQVYAWRFPFLNFQELSSCRYHVPLHESEDNGVTSTIFRSVPPGEENLICVTTWTQSGVPVLIQPEEGRKNAIKTEISSRQGRLGSRIQCAAFSPSGRVLALVNDKGHMYQISSLNSTPLEVKRIATSKEMTSKSDSFAMSFMSLPDEEAIVLAWTDPVKGSGFVKKIPMPPTGEQPTPSTFEPPRSELPGDSKIMPQPPVELTVEEETVTWVNRDVKQGF